QLDQGLGAPCIRGDLPLQPRFFYGQSHPGERRFASRLRRFLEDDYLIWYDVPIGPKHRHPDFLILHPARGLLVLEVKDWNLDTIFKADPEQFTLATGAGHRVIHGVAGSGKALILAYRCRLLARTLPKPVLV